MNPTPRPPLSEAPAEPQRGRVPSRLLHALLIDVEPANSELIRLWLADEGWCVDLEPPPGHPIAMILVEVAFPRHAERQRLRSLAEVWPGVPVTVLSPTFFAKVPSHGDVARQLGVAAVLATPLSRDSFMAAVRGVFDAAGR